MADIVDRLAAVDHELSRLEALRSLAQTRADAAGANRLEQEIGELGKVKAELREQLQRWVRR